MLAEDADARTTVNVLEGVHSIIDVTVYVWDPKGERRRTLTFGETRALWEYRQRIEQLDKRRSPLDRDDS